MLQTKSVLHLLNDNFYVKDMHWVHLISCSKGCIHEKLMITILQPWRHTRHFNSDHFYELYVSGIVVYKQQNIKIINTSNVAQNIYSKQLSLSSVFCSCTDNWNQNHLVFGYLPLFVFCLFWTLTYFIWKHSFKCMMWRVHVSKKMW
jgi:hypothetical protein